MTRAAGAMSALPSALRLTCCRSWLLLIFLVCLVSGCTCRGTRPDRLTRQLPADDDVRVSNYDDDDVDEDYQDNVTGECCAGEIVASQWDFHLRFPRTDCITIVCLVRGSVVTSRSGEKSHRWNEGRFYSGDFLCDNRILIRISGGKVVKIGERRGIEVERKRERGVSKFLEGL